MPPPGHTVVNHELRAADAQTNTGGVVQEPTIRAITANVLFHTVTAAACYQPPVDRAAVRRNRPMKAGSNPVSWFTRASCGGGSGCSRLRSGKRQQGAVQDVSGTFNDCVWVEAGAGAGAWHVTGEWTARVKGQSGKGDFTGSLLGVRSTCRC